MRKPNLGDYKYSGKDLKDARLELDRDLMLWEQNEMLAELVKQQQKNEEQTIEDAKYNAELERLTEETIRDMERTKEEQKELEQEFQNLQAKNNEIATTNEQYIHKNQDSAEAQIKLAQQLNINYLLIKKLYKLINRYGSKSPFLKQLLLNWIEFRQTHYDYDYEAFLDEFEYDNVITNRYETTHFPITPKTNGTKEDYENMIKKMINAILNDETYDPNDINNKNLFK